MKAVILRDFHYYGLKALPLNGTTFIGCPHQQTVPASSRVARTSQH
jgi:hypothetical protein